MIPRALPWVLVLHLGLAQEGCWACSRDTFMVSGLECGSEGSLCEVSWGSESMTAGSRGGVPAPAPSVCDVRKKEAKAASLLRLCLFSHLYSCCCSSIPTVNFP